jgi:hypothetical protein
MGAALGMFLAVSALVAIPGRVHMLVVGAYGAIEGPLGLIVGCAVLMGVGAAVTGYIFDELERS